MSVLSLRTPVSHALQLLQHHTTFLGAAFLATSDGTPSPVCALSFCYKSDSFTCQDNTAPYGPAVSTKFVNLTTQTDDSPYLRVFPGEVFNYSLYARDQLNQNLAGNHITIEVNVTTQAVGFSPPDVGLQAAYSASVSTHQLISRLHAFELL